jgi:hypothetical protein
MAAMGKSVTDQLDFALMYVAEAHATDLWPIRSSRANGSRGPVNIRSHQDDEERAVVATRFVNDFGMRDFRIFIDTLPNEEFEKAYAPWPVRIFCFDGTKLSYISEPHHAEVPIWELQAWMLERNLLAN